MQSTELSKRERRLRAAVIRIEERALELYPDAGDEITRKWARAKRHAFVAGALFWRYKDQQFAAEGAEMRRQQSERDKARNRSEGTHTRVIVDGYAEKCSEGVCGHTDLSDCATSPILSCAGTRIS